MTDNKVDLSFLVDKIMRDEQVLALLKQRFGEELELELGVGAVPVPYDKEFNYRNLVGPVNGEIANSDDISTALSQLASNFARLCGDGGVVQAVAQAISAGTAAGVSPGSINADSLAVGCVTALKLGDSAVQNRHIAAGAVGTSAFAARAKCPDAARSDLAYYATEAGHAASSDKATQSAYAAKAGHATSSDSAMSSGDSAALGGQAASMYPCGAGKAGGSIPVWTGAAWTGQVPAVVRVSYQSDSDWALEGFALSIGGLTFGTAMAVVSNGAPKGTVQVTFPYPMRSGVAWYRGYDFGCVAATTAVTFRGSGAINTNMIFWAGLTA